MKKRDPVKVTVKQNLFYSAYFETRCRQKDNIKMVSRKQLNRTEVFQVGDTWMSFRFSRVDLILIRIHRLLK
jgi:hypothetical protein